MQHTEATHSQWYEGMALRKDMLEVVQRINNDLSSRKLHISNTKQVHCTSGTDYNAHTVSENVNSHGKQSPNAHARYTAHHVQLTKVAWWAFEFLGKQSFSSFAMDILDDDEPFFGFDAEEIVFHEVWAECDINVGSVNSMHTSDLSDWDNRENDFKSDVDDQVDHPRDRHGWSKMMRNIGIKPFMQDTGPNVANFAENGTPKDFFPQFF